MADRTTPPPDATELADRIRRKAVSPLEVLDDAIARCEAMQPQLNFLVTPMFEAARARARSGTLAGPFAGVPYLMKDMYDIAGVPTRWGARFTQFAPLPAVTCAQVKAFEAAGLVIFGKTALGEFGWLPTTEPLAFGATHNPWNPAHSPGGSSGGSAAAVAAGVVPMADAADGGGSIRIPASACGLFGLKPTPRRLVGDQPGAGDVELTVEHCLSRSVRDSAGLFAATERTGADAAFAPIGRVTGPSTRRLRVGFVTESINGQTPDPEVRTGVERTAALLERLGHRVEAMAWPIDGALLTADFLKFYQAAALGVAEAVRAAAGRQMADAMLEPLTVRMADEAAALPKPELEKAVAGLRVHKGRYDAWLTRYDVILSPVMLTPPVKTGWIAGDGAFETLMERVFAYSDYTLIHNVVGAPAMSVPLHRTDAGLPVGMQFAAAAADERTLFELAYELEDAEPWAQRRPPIFAEGT